MFRFMLLCVLSYSFCAFAANNVASISNYYGVSTFECIGIYCDYSEDDNGNSECGVSYKEATSLEWKTGHPLWADRPESQYRGSVVNLRPNTIYDIMLTVYDADGAPTPVTFQDTTWNETFPIGQTITVSNQSATLNVTQSGTPQGYTLYTPNLGQQAVIDVNNTQMYGVNINADYVIIRGLKVTGAKAYDILINSWCHDIVIENCEITNWGPSGVGNFDWEEASGIRAYGGTSRIIVQNNVIHTPRGGSWYWDQTPSHPHPWGPQALGFEETDGNHVIRYNYCYSESLHYFNDGIGGGDNSGVGPLNKDSDVYGNHVTHCWDDALELEGDLVNCRVWGNLLHKTFVGISTAQTGGGIRGPVYLWRNIHTDSRKNYVSIGDGSFFKPGGPDGALFVYNNTLVSYFASYRGALNAVQFGSTTSQNMTCKNNIFHANPPLDGDMMNEPSNFCDYNCYLVAPSGLPATWEQHKVTAAPQYDTTLGTYQFFPKEGHLAVDKGCVIPNFTDNSLGNGPDIGAFERGGDTLKFGPRVPLFSGIIAGDSKGMLQVLPYSINCWPNPFSHTTNISSAALSPGNAQVKIYSLSGKLIRVLAIQQNDGLWNGLDNNEMPVAPGDYFVRVDVPGQSLQKIITKMR